ncbi:MAG TPA: asparagine synthase (glutamine-hydrolyzing) [Gaiellaceae bacterium]|nr:asparagine synthase (glutamine-hydrolyzing) [Gaiellaceae bacterium]
MCGICGIVALDHPAEADAVRTMTAALAHRGPDGERIYAADGVALGFRRLAILDLSDAGMQPFVSEDGRLHLIHNGEIYNYRELRTELEPRGHRFRTGTDTEVLLAAYREWGPSCVERFNGMWAFAIWDSERKQLFASRDRFGIKPFYYRLDGERLEFASELKAFRVAGPRLSANPVAVREYLEQGHLEHGEETFFAGIRRLPPAHNLWFDRDGLRLERHWRLEPKERPADAVAAVRELFLDSVRLRLRSDVPIGTCLSGGIDSSGIACGVDHVLRGGGEGAEQVGPHQRTFTAYFPERGFDERPFAEAVVQQIGAEPHWVTFTAEDFVERLPEIVYAQEEPFGSTSIVAQWYVMRAAHEAGLTVMLDGQGGDELFAGYSGYAGYYFADLLASGQLVGLGREMRGFRRTHGKRAAPELVRPFLSESAKLRLRGRMRGGNVLLHRDLRAAPSQLLQKDSPFPDRLRRQLEHILGERGLRELLRYEDRNSMAHSLEARLPFLDYRFVELVFSLRGGELINHGTTKWILRRALGDLLPAVVRDRTDKLGFVTPERRWLRGALGDRARDVFASQSFAQRGFVDATAARARLERHRRGEINAGWELWRALNLELWARAFLD